jgi:uncharacterized protein YbcI
MKTIPIESADALGYRAITKDIWPEVEIEKHIVVSIEGNLAGTDSVWLKTHHGAIQAARRKTELILSENELEKLLKDEL